MLADMAINTECARLAYMKSAWQVHNILEDDSELGKNF